MQIETKFNIGDKLWMIHNSDIIDLVVKEIRVEVASRRGDDIETKVHYSAFKDHINVAEHKLYKTKQEAGEAWIKSQGLKCGVSIAD